MHRNMIKRQLWRNLEATEQNAVHNKLITTGKPLA